jgi:hypothetical protein
LICSGACAGAYLLTGRRTTTLNHAADDGDDEVEEPRPTPFLTGPVYDLTEQRPGNGHDTSNTARSLNTIEIKDEPAEGATEIATVATLSSVTGDSPIKISRRICPDPRRFQLRFGCVVCDQCGRMTASHHWKCGECWFQACRVCVGRFRSQKDPHELSSRRNEADNQDLAHA